MDKWWASNEKKISLGRRRSSPSLVNIGLISSRRLDSSGVEWQRRRCHRKSALRLSSGSRKRMATAHFLAIMLTLILGRVKYRKQGKPSKLTKEK